MQLLAKGKRGLVYLDTYKGKKIAIKIVNPSSESNLTLEKEELFLKKLNKHNIGPQLYYFKNGKLGMEYIEGERILDYIENKITQPKHILNVLQQICKQVYMLDKLGINKYELTNPYKHIIVRNNHPIMIDFERCRHTIKTKNITQTIQFIVSKPVSDLLQKKGITLATTELLHIAKKYHNDDKTFQELLELFSPSTLATK